MRRRARILAVQALYLSQVGDEPVQTAITTAARLSDESDSTTKPPEFAYGERLALEADRRRIEIDQLLGRSGSRWRVDRMSPLDLQILRVAVCELLARPENVPTAVAIDEAVEVAREFGGESSPGFVNGVLDAVARELRAKNGPGTTGGGEGG